MIEQAKGILAARESITPDEAFQQIRRQARSERRKLHVLATEIVSSTSSPTLQLTPRELLIEESPLTAFPRRLFDMSYKEVRAQVSGRPSDGSVTIRAVKLPADMV